MVSLVKQTDETISIDKLFVQEGPLTVHRYVQTSDPRLIRYGTQVYRHVYGTIKEVGRRTG